MFQCNYTLERVCYHSKLSWTFLIKKCSKLRAFFHWPLKSASLHQDMNLWTSFFVEISHFKNDIAKSQKYTDSNANYLLNVLKSARVYNWSLGSFLSTPDRLQQHSVAGASCEFHYLEEQCRKRSRKLHLWCAISQDRFQQ